MWNIAEILALETVEKLTDKDGLKVIGQLVDYAFDQGDLDLTARALAWCEQLEARPLSARQRALLDYFRANAWANIQRARQADPKSAWAWDQEEVQQQIFLLRRAFNSPAFDKLNILRRCQILTNLANQLDTVGRFIEARALWAEALSQQSTFWMARGNRGRSLMHYADALYDPGHSAIFALIAHGELTQTLHDLDRYPNFGEPSVRTLFASAADRIARHFDLDKIAADYRPDDFKLGKTEIERRYRFWCLRETLFLNPLNDLGPHSIAARDVLTLPDFFTAIGEAPVLVGFFNQLKQEFVSARWLYFEGIEAKTHHFSDREALLYNTFDYPAYGLAVEKVKIAFRMSYSLLDKIAYFLNRYLDLGIPERQIGFRTIWREKDGGPIRPQLDASENWPFRGLYWLSKDLFEKGFKDLTEPDARALDDLRNHLEHKYVKVHGMIARISPSDRAELHPFFDGFAHSVSRDELERRSLRLLKLTRSALTYLSLGMHREERRRRARADPNALVPSVHLHQWDDKWKGRY
jgi:hypothetical protein